MKDWQIRALKTFIQAFLGIAVPELVAILNGSLPTSVSSAWALAVPVLCSSLAAGISAVWNVLNEQMNK